MRRRKSSRGLSIRYVQNLNAPPNVAFKRNVWRLLCHANYEFIPPLSARDGPGDIELDSGGAAKGAQKPTSYFQEICQQKTLLILRREKVVGFLSYKENYVVPELGRTAGAYVSTLIVNRRARGRGASEFAYSALMDRVRKTSTLRKTVVTRTWSTNGSHITILERIGFRLLRVIRAGRGKEIDTVVFGRSVRRARAQV